MATGEKMTTYIGIDPGLSGAIAAIRPNGGIEIADTPTMQVKKGKGKRNEYLPAQMAEFLNGYSNCHVFIEKVHSMPGQGVSSMFRMGEGYGLWIGILSALKIPFTKVTPQAWKKELMAGLKDKDAARGRAQELFPHAMVFLKRKKDCDRADALLIAEYGRRTLNR